MKTQVFAVALAATALAGSSDAVRANSRGSAEVIIEWNQTLQDTIPATAGLMSPRFYAMLHIAMFDAVNAIEREYTPTSEESMGRTAPRRRLRRRRRHTTSWCH